jgi:hypothetical protein
MIEQAAAKETEGITKDSSPDTLLSEKIATYAEGGLASEAGYLRDQARSSRNPEEGESLIF